MDSLVQFKKTIILQILITAAVVAGVTLGLGFKAAAKGFVLGSLFSLANFLAMAGLISTRLGKSPRLSGLNSVIGLLGRLALLGLPIFIAYKHSGQYNLIWTIIGIFNLQVTILIYNLIVAPYLLTNTSDP